MLAAATRISSAKEGSSRRPLNRSRMYAYPLTPSFLHVCTSVVKTSIDRAPRLLRLCKLTSRRRALTRAPNSESLLCNGTSGWSKTVSNSSFLESVLAIRSSNPAADLRLADAQPDGGLMSREELIAQQIIGQFIQLANRAGRWHRITSVIRLSVMYATARPVSAPTYLT